MDTGLGPGRGSVQPRTSSASTQIALHVPFDGSSFLALTFLSRLFVVFASTQLCQNAGLLAGSLETTQCCIEVLAFSDPNAWHTKSLKDDPKNRPAKAGSRE